VFDPEGLALLPYCLKQGRFRNGASTLRDVHELLKEIAKELTYLAKKHRPAVRLGVEAEMMSDLKSAVPRVKGLIILTSKKRTTVVPMTCFPGFCRLNEVPIFLDHEDGPELLLKAILAEVRVVVAQEANREVEGENTQPRD
jgi:hypothetical protein